MSAFVLVDGFGSAVWKVTFEDDLVVFPEWSVPSSTVHPSSLTGSTGGFLPDDVPSPSYQ